MHIIFIICVEFVWNVISGKSLRVATHKPRKAESRDTDKEKFGNNVKLAIVNE